MDIALDSSDSNLIHAYTDAMIQVATTEYRHSFIITPDTIIDPWPVNCIQQLDAAHCQAILQYQPNIVILGTGKQQHFPPPTILALFGTQHIGLEVMHTASACRTYNVLASEGRKVVAALIIEN